MSDQKKVAEAAPGAGTRAPASEGLPGTKPSAGGSPANAPKAGGAQATAAGSTPPKRTFREKMRRLWRVTVIGAWVLLGAVLGWGIGTIQGRLALQEARRGFEEDKSSLANKEQQRALRETALLSRRGMHQALVALEQRNFGLAQDRARQAGEQLASLGEDWAAFSEIAQQLSDFRPTVSDDISEQRTQLLDRVRRFDELWDERKKLQ